MFKAINVKKEYVILILVVFTNLILRLWRLSELFHFTYDESVFAFVGRRMFINGHIPLIGGVTPFHVHLSPFFYWLSGIILYISEFNPLGWGFAAGVLSSLTIIFLFIFTKEVLSKRVAFLGSLIYSFSVLINIYDRHYWGLVFNPLLSLLVLYSLFKIIKGREIFFLLLSGTLSFGFHTDPSTLVFIILTITTFLKYKISLKSRYFYLALFIFLLSFLPIIIFDLRHNFVNIKGAFQYVPEARESVSITPNRFLSSLILIPGFLARIMYLTNDTDLAKEYSYCQTYVDEKLTSTPFYLLLIAIFTLFGGLLRKTETAKAKIAKLLFNYLILSVFVGVLVYKGLMGRPFFEHYLSTLIPISVIFIALFIDKLLNKSRVSGSAIILLFIILNLVKLTKTYHSYGFKLKNEAVKWAINNTKTDFSLESLSGCFRYNGYRYLFLLNGKEPVKSFIDQNFFWLYDKLPAEIHPPIVVIMVTGESEKEKYDQYKEREIKSKKFGDLEVIIADNTKGILYDF
ncbi:MAG: glycosyltransferase family 39 protein [Candidatus Omnitrophica bacterium]|nr:glycosyltransferase family 39 protein [Candidatus Omnitrophota bacterium]